LTVEVIGAGTFSSRSSFTLPAPVAARSYRRRTRSQERPGPQPEKPGEELADVLGCHPVAHQRGNLVVRNPSPGNDRLTTTNARVDLDVFPRLQQSRNLPTLNVKRLQHLDELVNNKIALLPHEVYRVFAICEVNC
jgi:hypothetical protein